MTEDEIKSLPEINLRANQYFTDTSAPFLYQRRGVLMLLARPRTILGDDVGLGKGEVKGSFVLTPFGWKKIEELKVGEEVIGAGGRPVKVQGVYERGVLPVFWVKFNDGTSVKVDGDHLWAVRSDNYQKRDQPFIIKSTKELRGYLKYPKYKQLIWRIPMMKPAVFARRRGRSLDAYLVGSWLGDGYGTKIYAQEGGEIINELRKVLPDGIKLKRIKGHRRCPGWSVCGQERGWMRDRLRKLGLWGKRSWEKFIPEEYKRAPVEERVFLLQGLLDTDGEVRVDHISYSTSSGRLAEDVAEIVECLGGIVRRSSRIPKYRYRGVRREGRRSYKLTLQIPEGVQPTRVKEWIPRKKYKPNRLIEAIEEAGKEEVVCIAVNAPDQLYVTEHGIVTHNTIQAIVQYTYLKVAIPPMKAVVFTEKIALKQWESEFQKWTKGIQTKIITAQTHSDLTERSQALRNFDRDVLVTTYSTMYDYSYELRLGMGEKFVIYADECNYFKGMWSKINRRMKDLAGQAQRVYGLTAVVAENQLEEVYAMMGVINPAILPSLTYFQENFCKRRELREQRNGEWVPKRDKRGRPIVITTGYKNLGLFRDTIAPAYYGRLQTDPEVQQALPEAVEIDVPVMLGREQSEKVLEATDKLLTMPTGEVQELTVLSALTRVQQLVNDPGLLGFDVGAAKTEALIETLLGALAGHKVVVHSWFETMISRLEEDLRNAGIRTVRITGKETDEERDQNKEKFTTDPKVNVLLVTRAGLKGANLQAGEHWVWFDLTWSYGLYRQGIGRIKRTGSKYKTVFVHRMLAVLHPEVAKKAGTEETIDHYRLEVLKKKAKVWNVLTGDNDTLEAEQSDAEEVMTMMRKAYRGGANV